MRGIQTSSNYKLRNVTFNLSNGMYYQNTLQLTKYKSLTPSKKSLLNYYNSSLENNYNVDDPRS